MRDSLTVNKSEQPFGCSDLFINRAALRLGFINLPYEVTLKGGL